MLGFCSSDGNGLGGIESWYNSSLNGVNGKSFGYYDSNLNLIEKVKEAKNGNKIVSTIDINVQGVLEKKMKISERYRLKKYGCYPYESPKWGDICDGRLSKL